MTLNRDLTAGSTGSDVTNLQNYLIAEGYLSAGYNTGYYGSLTTQAVGKLQISFNKPTSSVSDPYGVMGPMTRAAIDCGTTSPLQNTTFSASPTSGIAPLNVTFNLHGSFYTFSVDFGDGKIQHGAINDADCSVIGRCQMSHTYTVPGTYVAKMLKLIGTSESRTGDPNMYQTMGTANITVADTTNRSGVSFSAAQTGQTTFTATGNGGGANYVGGTVINWGDGTANTTVCQPGIACNAFSSTHQYGGIGSTYTIRLWGIGEDTQTELGSATIVIPGI